MGRSGMRVDHKIINQHGRYLIGREREEIIYAIMRDMTYTYVDGVKVEIVSHTVFPNGEKVTRVKV